MKATPIYKITYLILDTARDSFDGLDKERLTDGILKTWKKELTEPLNKKIKELEDKNKELSRKLDLVPPAYRP